jgi:hypothetical protein
MLCFADMGLGLRPNAGIHTHRQPYIPMGRCCKPFYLVPLPCSSLLIVTLPQSAEIHSKHGVILDCSIKAVTSTSHGAVLEAFGQSFYIGKRYGFVENDEGAVNEVKEIADVKVWLRGAMS